MCRVTANWRARKSQMKITIETHDPEIIKDIEKEVGKGKILKHEEKDGDVYSITLNKSGYMTARANVDELDVLPHPDEMLREKEYEIRFEEYKDNEKIRRIGIGNSVLKEEFNKMEINDMLMRLDIYGRRF